nr:MAG TPA: putative integral membrane zinc-ribbon metal-binding protein [Caudoviricetes sp.]
MEDNKVLCPLVDDAIEDVDCIENRDVVDGMIVEEALPDKYKQKCGWKEICKKCKWHNY